MILSLKKEGVFKTIQKKLENRSKLVTSIQ